MKVDAVRAPRNAIEQYLSRRCRIDQLVSVADAVRALRMVLPACTLSDSELAQMMAIAALEHGHDVSFDVDMFGIEPSDRAA